MINKKLKVDSFKVIIPEEGKKFILDRIEKVIDSNTAWTDDVYVKKFEKEFSDFTAAKYSIAVNSGSTAIQAALFALGVDNEEYIAYVPTLTAPPTVYSCLYSGLKVVYVDSRKEDFGMDIDDLRKKILKYNKSKGVIIPVHISGIISKNIDEIIKIGAEYNMPVIEDCAHAHGATYNGIHAGMRGDIGVFSFFLTKVLMSGEGGMVLTNREEIGNKCKIIRNYGKVNGVYLHKGANWRMNEFTAVTALWQTIDANRILGERRKNAKYYDDLLKNNNFLKPLYLDESVKSSYYKYIVFIPEFINREKLKSVLKDEYGVVLSSGIYERPCHKEPVFFDNINILNRSDVFPQSEEIAKSHICLPIYPGLEKEEIEYVVSSLNKAINLIVQ